MTFTGYSLVSALSLLTVAAAMLFLLHLLRSRPQRLRVVTTMFWRSTRSAAQPRFLWHRFRYLATFLLLLGIISVLSMAISRPAWSWSALPARHTVIVIDAGLSMQATSPGAESRFEKAVAAAESFISRLDARDRLAIVVADPFARVVHGFDRPIAVAGSALSRSAPASQPCDGAGSMRLAASLLRDRTSPQIIHITDQREVANEDERTAPVRTILIGKSAANAAIVSAVFIPEPDQPSRGRLSARVGWWSDQPGIVPAAISIENQTAAETSLQVAAGGTAELVSPVIEARGQSARITLMISDALAADNVLTMRVPFRPDIVVAIDENSPEAIRIALEAASFRTVGRDEEVANVRFRKSTEPASDMPEIVLIDDGPAFSMSAAGLGVTDSLLGRELNFEQARAGEGCSIPPSSAETIIRSGGQVLAAMDKVDPLRKRLLLGSALFGPGSNVPDHPGFVQFVASCLWEVAGWDRPAWSLSSSRAVVDSAWAAETLHNQPANTTPGDVAASDTFAASSGAPAGAAEDTELSRQGRWPVPALLLVAALVLIMVEAGLHVRGRIV